MSPLTISGKCWAKNNCPAERQLLLLPRLVTVVCPSCFEEFSVAPPALEELPAEWDYDCEVCCRPLFISFEDDGTGDIIAEARGLAD